MSEDSKHLPVYCVVTDRQFFFSFTLKLILQISRKTKNFYRGFRKVQSVSAVKEEKLKNTKKIHSSEKIKK
jgi:hypothetical protein